MEHPHKDVRLAIASCLSEITWITAPTEAYYNDNMLRKVLQSIVRKFQELQNDKDPAFAKKVKILDTMTKVRSFLIMIDLECVMSPF